jgi:hypothetical protein
MKNVSKLLSLRLALALAVAAGLAASTTSSHAQGATATISDVAAGGGVFDYTILLQDTGSTSLNSFWYGWTTSGNNLPSNPTGAGNTLGWASDLDRNSIQWVNSTGTALAPGQSGTFTFVSTATPSAITTPPSGESVAYVNGITFTENNPGDSTSVFSPTLVVAPEPSSVSLLMGGLIALIILLKCPAASRKLRLTQKIAGVKSVRLGVQ